MTRSNRIRRVGTRPSTLRYVTACATETGNGAILKRCRTQSRRTLATGVASRPIWCSCNSVLAMPTSPHLGASGDSAPSSGNETTGPGPIVMDGKPVPKSPLNKPPQWFHFTRLRKKSKPTHDLDAIKSTFCTPAQLSATGTSIRTAAGQGSGRIGRAPEQGGSD